MIKDFISLIYPNTCYSCEEVLVKGDQKICTKCYVNLPITNYHLDAENPLKKRFYGKIKIENAFSYLKFLKIGSVQKLIHKLKYDRKEDIGEILGYWFGKQLKKDISYDYNYIIPVPMHKEKEKRRGYNQTHSIAKGLSKALDIPWSKEIISKKFNTTSQIFKSRFDRWKNTELVFELTNKESVEGLKILLIDDVVTTGATLENCARVLLEKGKCKELSIATIAIAL